MSLFFSEHKETIKIIGGIVIGIAGFVLMILGQPLIGLIALAVGMVVFCRTLANILHSGGYSGEGVATNGMGGMGRQQSAKSEMIHSTQAAPETSSDIWSQMTNDN